MSEREIRLMGYQAIASHIEEITGAAVSVDQVIKWARLDPDPLPVKTLVTTITAIPSEVAAWLARNTHDGPKHLGAPRRPLQLARQERQERQLALLLVP